MTCVGIPVLGNFRPDLVSFLPSMRYYAGNWATSQWLFQKESGAEAKLDSSIVKAAPVAVEQLAKFYDRDTAELLMCKGLAFRSMHAHGRALNGLLPRAVDDVERYDVREGEVRRRRRARIQLRRWPLPQRAAAGGGAGAVQIRGG